MLAKFVFPLMKYDGFVGLTMAEAKAKNQNYCNELKEHWKALKTQETEVRCTRRCIACRCPERVFVPNVLVADCLCVQ